MTPMPVRRFSRINQDDGQDQSANSMFGVLAAMGLVGLAAYAASKTQAVAQAEEAAVPEGMREVHIDFVDSLGEGEMRTVKVGEKDSQKVLISRWQGKLYATGSFCSHFGVPLEGGMLFDDKVLCPAHAAGFSVVTGEPEQAPGLNGLPTFAVTEREGKFFVQVPLNADLPGSVAMPLAKRDPDNKLHYVIAGGGPAGLNCAETLRQSGFTGQITVLSKEDVIPYDRTLLSKALPGGDPSKWSLRPAEYLKDADIEYRLKSKGAVFSINPEKKQVITSNGDHIEYDKLLIATGSQVFFPPVEGLGKDLREVPKKVHFLRSAADMLKIKDAVKEAKTVIVVGASFIGAEVASSLISNNKTLDLHMICETDCPLEAVFGKEVGALYLKQHVDAGVKVHTKQLVRKINTNDKGEMVSILLSNGTELAADMVIMATGVIPATKFLEDSGIEMGARGSVAVDPFLQTNQKDIYAAGDIAQYPYWPTGAQTRCEHWVAALDMGTYAAFNMLGKMIPYSAIPFFWTRQYNQSLQYVGNGMGYKTIHIEGDVMASKFIAYYIGENDQVLACAGMGNGANMLVLFEALNQNKMPRGSEIAAGRETPETIKKRIKQNTGAGKCRRANCCRKKSIA